MLSQGQVSVSDLSVEQMEAMAGRGTLRRQTVAIGQALTAKMQARGRERIVAALREVRSIGTAACGWAASLFPVHGPIIGLSLCTRVACITE